MAGQIIGGKFVIFIIFMLKWSIILYGNNATGLIGFNEISGIYLALDISDRFCVFSNFWWNNHIKLERIYSRILVPKYSHQAINTSSQYVTKNMFCLLRCSVLHIISTRNRREKITDWDDRIESRWVDNNITKGSMSKGSLKSVICQVLWCELWRVDTTQLQLICDFWYFWFDICLFLV